MIWVMSWSTKSKTTNLRICEGTKIPSSFQGSYHGGVEGSISQWEGAQQVQYTIGSLHVCCQH